MKGKVKSKKEGNKVRIVTAYVERKKERRLDIKREGSENKVRGGDQGKVT